MKYPLAPNGLFWSIQGEGALIGLPMVFIRLAGCSIGCPLCDTDYRVSERIEVEAIADRARELSGRCRWAWITGGEPTDHELGPLVSALRRRGFTVALATAGHKVIPPGMVDYLSVSPHDPAAWVQRRGDELKIIPGLNGHGLESFAAVAERACFQFKYVCPCDGLLESYVPCIDWVANRPDWRLGIQAHKHWDMP